MSSDASGHRRSRWSDLDRPPLNAAALRDALVRRDGMWTSLDVAESVDSTNTVLVRRMQAGEARPGAVLVAEEQTAGRGRLERGWTAPARSGIFVSVSLRPSPPAERWGWIPLLVGVGAARALARAGGVDTLLKWPNDLLTEIDDQERKIGGILAERAADGTVVVGIGINVSLREEELPAPGAGSLALAGAPGRDRDPLLRALLRSVELWYGRWSDAEGDPAACGLLEAYAAGCTTLGREVRAELPGGESVAGEAVAVDGDGRLVLATESGMQRPVGAGDIVHLRPAGGR